MLNPHDRFDFPQFELPQSVIGSNSTVANRLIDAAKKGENKCFLPYTWEVYRKRDFQPHPINQSLLANGFFVGEKLPSRAEREPLVEKFEEVNFTSEVPVPEDGGLWVSWMKEAVKAPFEYPTNKSEFGADFYIRGLLHNQSKEPITDWGFCFRYALKIDFEILASHEEPGEFLRTKNMFVAWKCRRTGIILVQTLFHQDNTPVPQA